MGGALGPACQPYLHKIRTAALMHAPSTPRHLPKPGWGWRAPHECPQLHAVGAPFARSAPHPGIPSPPAGLLEKNAQALLAGLNQMDRTLSHRRHDLDALLAGVSGKRGTHADSKLGKASGLPGGGGGGGSGANDLHQPSRRHASVALHSCIGQDMQSTTEHMQPSTMRLLHTLLELRSRDFR